MEVYDTDNTSVQMIMVIKLQELIKEIPSVTYDNLEDYLNKKLWKKKRPGSLHEAADQILAVTDTKMVQFLAQEAINDTSKDTLNILSDLQEE